MDDTLLRSLGRRIAARREALGHSVDRFAAEVGVEPDRLRAIEAGKHDPGFILFCRIARALDLPVAALLEGGDAD